MTPSKAASQLKLAALVVGGIGAVLALAALPPLSALGSLFLDLAFWPLDGRQSGNAPEARLLLGIGGGLTVGLSVMAWMVADRVMPRDPLAARAIVTVGVGSWFVVDSLASIAAGAPINAVLNVPLLLAFLWPCRALQERPA